MMYSTQFQDLTLLKTSTRSLSTLNLVNKSYFNKILIKNIIKFILSMTNF
jgi:hypothetical protein